MYSESQSMERVHNYEVKCLPHVPEHTNTALEPLLLKTLNWIKIEDTLKNTTRNVQLDLYAGTNIHTANNNPEMQEHSLINKSQT